MTNYHYFCLMAIFLGKPESAGSPLGRFPPSVVEENLWTSVEWVFLQTRCPSCKPIKCQTFFIQNHTHDGTGIAAFTLAL